MKWRTCRSSPFHYMQQFSLRNVFFLMCCSIIPRVTIMMSLFILFILNYSNPTLVARLISEGIDIHAQDDKGETPLFVSALTNSRLPCMKLLLEAGADPTIRVKNLIYFTLTVTDNDNLSKLKCCTDFKNISFPLHSHILCKSLTIK